MAPTIIAPVVANLSFRSVVQQATVENSWPQSRVFSRRKHTMTWIHQGRGRSINREP